MKFKQILKKALKYVVTPFALVCCIIGLYSINSYAYVTDDYSHTCTYETTLPTNYLVYSLDNVGFNNKTLLVNIDVSNLTIGNYQNNLSVYLNCGKYNEGSFTNDVANLMYNYSVNTRFSNNGVYTIIYNFSQYGLTNNNSNAFIIDFRYNYTGTTYMDLTNDYILNIDLVDMYDITTMTYLDTYVSNYQQQLAQLQEDYDTLEGQYNTLSNNYNTLENNYNTLEDNYNTLESEYEQKQNEYDMLTNGQLGYLDYMEFYINNQSIEFGNDSETELDLNELIDYNLYANNSLYLSYFTSQQVNPNYLPLKIVSYYDELPVNLFNMYFNGVTSGIIKVGYYNSSQYILKQIFFDNTETAVDSINSSLINYEIFKGLNVDYIEYIEIQFNNADLIAGSINFNSTYNIAYSTGYTNGYNYGYNVSDNVNSEKIDNARQEGYQNGYDVGKQDGISIGSNENNTLYGMVIRTL